MKIDESLPMKKAQSLFMKNKAETLKILKDLPKGFVLPEKIKNELRLREQKVFAAIEKLQKIGHHD